MLFSGVQDITFLNLAKASIFELDSKIWICAGDLSIVILS